MRMSIKLGLRWFNKSNCPRPGNPDNPQPLSPAEKFAGLLFYLLLSALKKTHFKNDLERAKLGLIVEEIKTLLSDFSMPTGYEFKFGGEQEKQAKETQRAQS